MASFRLNISNNIRNIINRFRDLPERTRSATIMATDEAADIAYRHAAPLAPNPEQVRVTIENTSDGARANVYSDDLVNYIVSEGWGLYGPRQRKYPIVPRTKRALRWEEEGRVVFAKRVMHPGAPGNRWMERAAESADQEILDVYRRRVGGAI